MMIIISTLALHPMPPLSSSGTSRGKAIFVAESAWNLSWGVPFLVIAMSSSGVPWTWNSGFFCSHRRKKAFLWFHAEGPQRVREVTQRNQLHVVCVVTQQKMVQSSSARTIEKSGSVFVRKITKNWTPGFSMSEGIVVTKRKERTTSWVARACANQPKNVSQHNHN